ncbi:CPBP family intramembrane glutamic endopeptidase [Luxibacter massiliensis]|uniref:CPBP family intramembrane glutamic endopeptidase n=1 Tax=Luxibacter massiliensis TaxID=2219695 RepID=UPI000F0681D8|nr:CPBP family intramembrane glutamic endopeptidase [Luxibacter massiliensis]
MYKNPNSKQFWRLCGPLLLYWGIEFVIRFFAEIIVIIPHIGEIVAENKITGTLTQDEIMELAMQNAEKVYTILQQYQVEILTAAAICTIPLTLTLFLMDRKREKSFQIPQNKKADTWRYVQIVVLGAALCTGMNCLSIMTNLAFASSAYQEVSEIFYSASLPVQYICLGVIIPVTEELMFRGILFRRFREQNSPMKAALLAALLFSISHGNMVQFIYTFVLGVFLGYTYEKFGSFKAPVVLHIVVNMISLILTDTGALTWLSDEPLRMGIVTVICAFAGSAMFVLIQKINEKPDGGGPSEESNISPDMFR